MTEKRRKKSHKDRRSKRSKKLTSAKRTFKSVQAAKQKARIVPESRESVAKAVAAPNERYASRKINLLTSGRVPQGYSGTRTSADGAATVVTDNSSKSKADDSQSMERRYQMELDREKRKEASDLARRREERDSEEIRFRREDAIRETARLDRVASETAALELARQEREFRRRIEIEDRAIAKSERTLERARIKEDRAIAKTAADDDRRDERARIAEAHNLRRAEIEIQAEDRKISAERAKFEIAKLQKDMEVLDKKLQFEQTQADRKLTVEEKKAEREQAREDNAFKMKLAEFAQTNLADQKAHDLKMRELDARITKDAAENATKRQLQVDAQSAALALETRRDERGAAERTSNQEHERQLRLQSQDQNERLVRFQADQKSADTERARIAAENLEMFKTNAKAAEDFRKFQMSEFEKTLDARMKIQATTIGQQFELARDTIKFNREREREEFSRPIAPAVPMDTSSLLWNPPAQPFVPFPLPSAPPPPPPAAAAAPLALQYEPAEESRQLTLPIPTPVPTPAPVPARTPAQVTGITIRKQKKPTAREVAAAAATITPVFAQEARPDRRDQELQAARAETERRLAEVARLEQESAELKRREAQAPKTDIAVKLKKYGNEIFNAVIGQSNPAPQVTAVKPTLLPQASSSSNASKAKAKPEPRAALLSESSPQNLRPSAELSEGSDRISVGPSSEAQARARAKKVPAEPVVMDPATWRPVFAQTVMSQVPPMQQSAAPSLTNDELLEPPPQARPAPEQDRPPRAAETYQDQQAAKRLQWERDQKSLNPNYEAQVVAETSKVLGGAPKNLTATVRTGPVIESEAKEFNYLQPTFARQIVNDPENASRQVAQRVPANRAVFIDGTSKRRSERSYENVEERRARIEERRRRGEPIEEDNEPEPTPAPPLPSDDDEEAEDDDDDGAQLGSGLVVDGSGYVSDEEGLEDREIDAIFDDRLPYRVAKTYHGTYASDELSEIDNLPQDEATSMIINLDKASGPGTHWVALWIDPRPSARVIEYFDSFGEAPPKALAEEIQRMVKANFSSLPVLLKFKSNGVKHQRVTSPNCGFFAIDFIRKRAEGIPFDIATGYTQLSQVNEGEAAIKRVKHQFGYA